MLDPELLEILVCPETKAPLRLAEEAVLEELNRAIAEGKLRTRGGEVVKAALHEGLIREDDLVVYPVRDDIPIMLIDEAILLDAS